MNIPRSMIYLPIRIADQQYERSGQVTSYDIPVSDVTGHPTINSMTTRPVRDSVESASLEGMDRSTELGLMPKD